MVDKNNIADTLMYLQRINYSLKVYYLKNNLDRSNFSKGRIMMFDLNQTMTLYKDYRVDCDLTVEDEEAFKNLKKYYNFICNKCYLEFCYDLNPSIYMKKVEYINAKVEHIKSKLVQLCYKLESVTFENNK